MRETALGRSHQMLALYTPLPEHTPSLILGPSVPVHTTEGVTQQEERPTFTPSCPDSLASQRKSLSSQKKHIFTRSGVGKKLWSLASKNELSLCNLKVEAKMSKSGILGTTPSFGVALSRFQEVAPQDLGSTSPLPFLKANNAMVSG